MRLSAENATACPIACVSLFDVDPNGLHAHQFRCSFHRSRRAPYDLLSETRYAGEHIAIGVPFGNRMEWHSRCSGTDVRKPASPVRHRSLRVRISQYGACTGATAPLTGVSRKERPVETVEPSGYTPRCR
jgi:hypothetical protein